MQITESAKSNISKILLIEDLESETIHTILAKMRALLEIFKSEKVLNHFVPFLHTYVIVTEKIIGRMASQSDSFQDLKLIEKFNNYFASLYFKPLNSYLINDIQTSPWSSYFEFCSSTTDHPLLQLLLGANAHINSDLCEAIADFNYTEDNDFQLVQELLFETIPQIMKYLAFEERDILGFGGLILSDFYKKEFTKVVLKWRNNSRKNAEKIKNDRSQLEILQKETDAIGTKMIGLWANWYKPANLMNFLKDLNSLEVIL